MSVKTTAGLTARKAAQRAGVPVWQVERLISETVIFGRKDMDGNMLVSPAVVGELPGLCKTHFTPGGEFLANPPVYGVYRDRSIGDIRFSTYREVF